MADAQSKADQATTYNVCGAPTGGPALTARQRLVCEERNDAKRTQITRKPDGAPLTSGYHVPHGLTPDEEPPAQGGFARFAASFHKLLPHDASTGLLTDDGKACRGEGNPPGTSKPDSGVCNYRRLLLGLKVNSPSSDFDADALNDLDLLNRNPTPDTIGRVLINPRSSKALSIKGPDITSLRVWEVITGNPDDDNSQILDLIRLGSAQTAAEIVEAYAMALLRPIVLGSYDNNSRAEMPGDEEPDATLSDAELAVRALNSFEDKFIWGYDKFGNEITAANQPVTFANLFRGPSAGDLIGDYLSVFLTFPRPPLFPSGCAPFVADLIEAGKFAMLLGEELRVPLGRPLYFGVTWDHYVAIQNADIPQPYPDGFFTGRTPIRTGLDLGNYVHVDNVYEQYIRAADILVGGQYDRSPVSPYVRNPPAATGEPAIEPFYRNEADGPTLGPSDAYALLGGVREVAERAAFTQKWLVARRARPEVMAGLVHFANLVSPGKLNGDQQKLQQEVREALPDELVLPPDPSKDTPVQAKVRALFGRVAEVNKGQQEKWQAVSGNEVNTTGEANYLLSQMYPEGSPAHPAWTSGHATVAGACVTVLKAIFNDLQFIVDPFATPECVEQKWVDAQQDENGKWVEGHWVERECRDDADGSGGTADKPGDAAQQARGAAGQAGEAADERPREFRPVCKTPRRALKGLNQLTSMVEPLTVGGELDKLASNGSFGRNFGGVHYRSDGEHGILLGEAVAIRYLQDHLREYREEFRPCPPEESPADAPAAAAGGKADGGGTGGGEGAPAPDPATPHRCFVLTKRNGQRICITADDVTEIATPPTPAPAPGTKGGFGLQQFGKSAL